MCPKICEKAQIPGLFAQFNFSLFQQPDSVILHSLSSFFVIEYNSQFIFTTLSCILQLSVY